VVPGRSVPPSHSRATPYADPPYPGQSAKHYADHPDYAGEVDHKQLIKDLQYCYHGWVLHTSSTTLQHVLALCPDDVTYRVMAWVKPFAAFKRNVSVAYAWEPVIVSAARKPVVSKRMVYRDWDQRVDHAQARPDRSQAGGRVPVGVRGRRRAAR
jgi:hypothetical protein